MTNHPDNPHHPAAPPAENTEPHPGDQRALWPSDSAPRMVIAGGNGFVGGLAASWFARRGWQVTVLGRRFNDPAGPLPPQDPLAPPAAGPEPLHPGTITRQPWDGLTLGGWAASLDGAQVLLNLSGRSVNCRYHAANRRAILESRLSTTRLLGEALAVCRQPPPVWLNAASATYYRHAEDRPMDEIDGEAGEGFSVDVCRQWEQTLMRAPAPEGVRRVALRMSIVMGRGAGGPYDILRRLVRLGLGGHQGDGRQRVSWIHHTDLCRALDWIIARPDLAGPVNLAAPNSPTNREFMRELRAACGRRLGLPASRWMLELGALALRTETELILKSRWINPLRLLESGFEFKHTRWAAAAHDLESTTSTPTTNHQ